MPEDSFNKTTGTPPPKRDPRSYTPEELGVDPARDAKMFGILAAILVALLVIGFIILGVTLFFELRDQEPVVPENPNAVQVAATIDPETADANYSCRV